MAIYNNGVKYNVAGYVKEYVGSDLVWQNRLTKGEIIQANDILSTDNNSTAPAVTYRFKQVRSDLSNVPNGIIIHLKAHTPIAVGKKSQSGYVPFVLDSSNVLIFDTPNIGTGPYFFDTIERFSLTYKLEKQNVISIYPPLINRNSEILLSVYNDGKLVKDTNIYLLATENNAASILVRSDENGSLALQTSGTKESVGMQSQAIALGYPIPLIDSIEVY